MEALLVGAAERQETERSPLPERYQRERGHLGALGPEEKVALRVARLATARFARGEQRLEGLEVRISRRHGAHEVLTGQIRVFTDEHEHRMERVEILAQAGLDARDRRLPRRVAQQPSGEAVQAFGDGVIRTCDPNQLAKL